MRPRWTVFLDRDGVLNRKAPEGEYIADWASFVWLRGSLSALRRLGEAGVRIIVATNQQGVAKGVIRPADLESIHRRLTADAAAAGARLDAIYVCPHAAGTCDCRKPDVGLFLQAQRDFPDIRFEHAIVVGDSGRDIEAGRRLGAWTIRITAGGEDEREAHHASAPDLLTAVERVILPWCEAAE